MFMFGKYGCWLFPFIFFISILFLFLVLGSYPLNIEGNVGFKCGEGFRVFESF